MYNESVLTPELVEILANIMAGMGSGEGTPDIGGNEHFARSTSEELGFLLSPTSAGSSSTNAPAYQVPRLLSDLYNSVNASTVCSMTSATTLPVSSLTSHPTTLMLKNLPNTLTREELFLFISQNVPTGGLNFLYMPIDYKNRLNFGYAFVNLINDVYVEAFFANVAGKKVRDLLKTTNCPGGGSRPLDIVPARVQGFSANINRLIASPVLFTVDEQSLPLIFYNDVQVSFRDLMNLNRASILYQTKPSVEELIQALICDQQYQRI